MKRNAINALTAAVAALLLMASCTPKQPVQESEPSKMDWWSNDRFGMFIHWGLYSIPAGEWNGNTGHAEWIRTTAEIPIDVYDTLRAYFNPVKFDAAQWVKTAKDAGMKYIVITSKHHDGFCLFDSEFTDFDVMSTPFKRDILGELADECHKQGVVLCFYYSIMDWHHPDYLPRRKWEKDRPTEGAEPDRYVTYMKNQLRELTTKYGAIGVMWFDGEWESAWTHPQGVDLYNYVISLQPGIIVNNRVDKGRRGMQGMTMTGGFMGDFGTPEQEVPDTGFPGQYWESCMTLNDHWGYNRADTNWKKPVTVIRMLADISSKGGNLLLNIGPRSDGSFPDESIAILGEVGMWTSVNGESIYGTSASPFRSAMPWGRCTMKMEGEYTLLYLHVFDWPADAKLTLPALKSKPSGARLLADKSKLKVHYGDNGVTVDLPATAPDPYNTVVVLKIKGLPVTGS